MGVKAETIQPQPFDTKDSPPHSSTIVRAHCHHIVHIDAGTFECIRFGEAKNPGPTTNDYQPQRFTLGYGNPTGIIGKEHLLQQLPRGVWGFAETHLTQRGIQKCRLALRCQQGSNAPRIIPGAFATYLSQNIGTIGGKAEGVCFLTHVPGRPLHHDWPKEVWHSARLQAAAFQVGQRWIQGGICYGYAKNASTKEVQQRTDQLLKHLTDRIVLQSHGPRFIMGDFNQTWNTLDQIKIWREYGFIEAQHYALSRWNQPIKATCKGKTVKDYIWLSKELLPFVHSVEVDDTWFADHAIIKVTLTDLGQSPTFPLWRKPAPIEWKGIKVDDAHVPSKSCAHLTPDINNQTTDAIYTDICQRFESAVNIAQIQQKGTGLISKQTGRGTTTEVEWIKDRFVPPKRSRPGDFVATFVGDNITHAYWIRQLRRIHSLARMTQSDSFTESNRPHAAALWRSIVSAKGFAGGFKKYWVNRGIHHPDTPNHIPSDLPTPEDIIKIKNNFQAEFALLEKTLNAERLQKAKWERSKDPNKIYQDVTRPQALPVQTLVDTNHATVMGVSENGKEIQYEPKIFDTDQPVQGPEGYLICTNHQQGSFQVPDDANIQIGDQLTQRIIVGDMMEVFHRFKQLWEKRWDRHRHTEPERWQPFLDFLQQVPQPTHEMPLPPITVSDWYAAVRTKKNRTASGPDGFNKQDLVNMPPTLVQDLIDLIRQIEEGQKWPIAMTTGLISAIEKSSDAQTPSQFRPITVLSLAYRVWSSIRARQLLDWLSLHSPDGLCGNRKGHSTAQVWWQISSQLEHTWHEDLALSGAIGDIIKCFNNLPRVPILSIAKHMKIPDQLIIPWFNAISQLQRRFVVSGGVGPICWGVTGFPEGDPLSVCSMYLVNIVMDQWITHHLRNSMLMTFVDNIEVISRDFLETAQAMEILEQFCHLLDIELDSGKTVFWAATTEARKHFRQLHLNVSMGGRDLGGHVAYCKRHTNSTITTRCVITAMLWDQLKRSTAPIHQKAKVCHTVAWPRALHGSSTVNVAPAKISTLRAGAMRALGFARKGASPLIQMSLCLPSKCDPGYWMLRETVMQFRRCCEPDKVFPLLDSLAFGKSHTTFPGPCGIFLKRIHEICWCWIGNGWINDHDGYPLHILHTPIQLLCLRIEQAWGQHIGSMQVNRRTMKGMHNVDHSFSMQGIDKLSGEDQGILRVAMNGTFYTNDKLVHGHTVQSKACPWCPSEDSITHRHLHCPYMRDFWEAIPESRREEIQDAPPCLVNHLWFPDLQASPFFRKALLTIPDTTDVFEPLNFQSDIYHLFTDGSCLKPETPRLRLATWAVVAANLQTQQFEPVSTGGVTGLLQTIGRAEFLAALAALRFLLTVSKGGFIWIDNLLVQQTVRDYLQGGAPPEIMDADHDLKQRIFSVCRRLQTQQIPVKAVKVRSHEDETAYTEFVERWAIRGNNQADRLASEARRSLPTAILQIWPGLVHQHDRQVQWRKDLRHLFLQVGKRALQTKSEREEKAHEAPFIRPQPDVPPDFPEAFFPFPNWEDRNLETQLGEAGPVVFEWIRDLTQDTTAEPMWISTYQLLVDFQLTTSQIGPRLSSFSKTWDLGDIEDFDFFQYTKWLGVYLRKLSGSFHLPLKTQIRRPDGTLFATWCRPFLIRAPANRVDRADQILLEWAKRPVKLLHRELKGCGPWIRSRG